MMRCDILSLIVICMIRGGSTSVNGFKIKGGSVGIEIIKPAPSGWPEWVDRHQFTVKDGRDPLGLETITTDRIVPLLVPGILALSGRARYVSLHLFLLDEFARRRLEPTAANQSIYMRRCEYDFGAAVLLCERCGAEAAPVGAMTLRPIVRRAEHEVPRGFSVDSDLGGYGLYYRTPLRELGLVTQRGTPMDNRPIPIDLLASPRAEAIADAFREAIKDTAFYRQYFLGQEPIPRAVLQAFARVGCLCRLAESPHEVDLVRRAFFEEWSGVDPEAVRRRRQAFALMLRLAETTPEVFKDEAWHRRATLAALESTVGESSAWATTVQRWAALYGKEYYQDGLLVLWRGVNRLGREHCPPDGMPPSAFLDLVRRRLSSASLPLGAGTVALDGSQPTNQVLNEVARRTVGQSLEDLRSAYVGSKHALAGILMLLALCDRARVMDTVSDHSGWQEISRQGGNSQPGLHGFISRFRAHLSQGPVLADTLAWLVQNFVIRPHDQIATTKLPDFTFRFRLEGDRLKFYDSPGIEFGLADSRHSALSSLGRDMDLWNDVDGIPRVMAAGRDLVRATFI